MRQKESGPVTLLVVSLVLDCSPVFRPGCPASVCRFGVGGKGAGRLDDKL